MKLHIFMAKNKLTDKKFATKIERDRSSVTRYRNGTQVPPWQTQIRILVETKGQVAPNDWLPDELLKTFNCDCAA